MAKEKQPLIIKTIKYTDQELKSLINAKFGEHNVYFKLMNEAINNLTSKHREGIENIMASLRKIDVNKDLSDQELECLMIKIPAEMYYLNKYLESRALDSELAQYFKDRSITEKALTIVGGTEKERTRAAEYESLEDTLVALIKGRVYYNIKNELEYVSKMYDGLKKIMNSRIQDKQLNIRENSKR